MPFNVSADSYTFHVVREDKSRNAHVLKRTDNADEEILLPRIGEELHIPLTATMTDHSEASYLKLGTVWVQNC